MQATDSELFIALVAAVGTDLGMLTTEFETELTAYGYTTHQIRLSDFLAELQGHDFTGLPFDERLWAAMDAGNQLRRDWGRGDVLALAAISDIVATRRETAPSREEDGEDTQPVNLDRAAFVIRSLKTPDELRTLRAVYGSSPRTAPKVTAFPISQTRSARRARTRIGARGSTSRSSS